MALPLEVFADLQLSVDGEDVSVQADGRRIVVDLATLEAGQRMLAGHPFSAVRRPASTGRLHDVLQIAGLTLEVRLRGDTIARMGAGARPGRVAQFLRLDGIELRPARSLRVVARERPVLTALVIGGLFALLGWGLARLFRS